MDTEKDTGRAGLQLHLQKYWRVLAVLLVLMVAVCVRSDEQSLEQARGDEPDEPTQAELRVNWKLLTEHWSDINVTSVAFTFDEEWFSRIYWMLYRGEKRVENVSFTTTNLSTLKIVKSVCCQPYYSPVRIARADDSAIQGATGNNQPFGKMTFAFSGGSVVDIGITQHGFTLGGGDALDSSTFYSTLLALEVDSLYLGKTGRHLPAELISSLSGETRMREERKAFYELSVLTPTPLPAP